MELQSTEPASGSCGHYNYTFECWCSWCLLMSRTRLAYCGVRGAYGQEENNLLRNVCLVVGGPVNCERKECVVAINDEHQSNSNSGGGEAAQDPRCTSRRQQRRQRRQQHERLYHYSPQGIGCLFCCEKKSMVVVLLVSMTSNVETRMVVNHTAEPPERMESKRYGCNLPDVLFTDIFTKRVKLSPLATKLDSYSIPTSFGGNVRF